MAYAFDLGTQEAEACGFLGVWGQSGPHGEFQFQTSQENIVRETLFEKQTYVPI